jgi:hypothetical protein
MESQILVAVVEEVFRLEVVAQVLSFSKCRQLVVLE